MSRTADLHLLIPEEFLVEIDLVARERGIRRTQLLREMIVDSLRRWREEQDAGDMRAYAEEMGEASGEFVREAEPHVVRRLLRETEW